MQNFLIFYEVHTVFKIVKQTTMTLATQAVLLGALPMVALGATFRLEEATVGDINAAFDAGALTSERLTQLYLNRIEAYDNNGPKINSIITVNPKALETATALDLERQLTGPRSALHGIPILLKDNYDTSDLPTTAGSDTLAGSIPPDDAFTVQQFRDAGAIILGKANLSEFATPAGRGAYSSLGGLTLNPYNLERDPSGSSGGTGASIAANFSTIGTGSDTGGSIRGPAAANGLVGIRPTFGLISRDGIIPQALSLDTAGPITRTVTDAAIALGVMTGIDPNDTTTLASKGRFYKDYTQFLNVDGLKGARIGIARDFFGGDPEVDQLTETAVAKMEELGATIVDPIDFDDDFLNFRNELRASINSEFQPYLEDYLATLKEEYPKTLEEIIAIYESPEIVNSETPINPGLIATHKRNLEIGGLDNPDYIDAIENGLPLVRNTVLSIMEDNNLDALVYPTSRCPAPPIFTTPDPTFVCNPGQSATSLASYSGFPDIQVPAGFTEDGLPTTISFLGRAYSEPTLLGVAYSYEQATMNRLPPATTPPLPGEMFEYEPVPEPSSTVALSVFGLAALGRKLKQRSKIQKR